MKLILSLLIATFFSLNIYASEASGPIYLMAALGDSISAAFLANTSLAKQSKIELPPFMTDQDMKNWIHAQNFLDNKKTLSWTSGMKTSSHFAKLTQYFHRTEPTAILKMYNLAISGSKSQDLVPQANQLYKAMQSGNYKAIKYITVLVGANDACNQNYSEGTPISMMEDSLKTVFSILAQIKQDEPIRILVSGIPKIPDVGYPEIQMAKSIGGISCNYIQTHLFKACTLLTTWKTKPEYEASVAIVVQKNELLRRVVQEANELYPNLSVVYTDMMFDRKISVKDLAIDCFHPNQIAQSIISEKLWPQQPWFKQWSKKILARTKNSAF